MEEKENGHDLFEVIWSKDELNCYDWAQWENLLPIFHVSRRY